VYTPVVTVDSANAYLNSSSNVLGISVSGLESEMVFVDSLVVHALNESGVAYMLPAASAISSFDSNGTDYTAVLTPVIGEEVSGTLTQIEVFATDSSGQKSNSVIVDIVETPSLAEGDACDNAGVLNVCVEGFVCVDTCTDESEIVAECPDAYTVIDLNEGDLNYTGDNSTSSTISEGGTCGGAGPVDVFSFTAETDGSYYFMTEGASDMLIYARRYCTYTQAAFELACNDDYVGLNSGIQLELTAGETTYIFADSYNGEGAGAYTLMGGSGELP
jgi:hypothetical protein